MWTGDVLTWHRGLMRALTDQEQTVLRVLCWSDTPLTGRQVSVLVGYSPTTTNRVLKTLQSEGLATSKRNGKSAFWASTPDSVLALPGGEDTVERVAIVVTALGFELTAMKNLLLNPVKDRVQGFTVWRGELIGETVHWTIYLAQAGVGNPGAAALVGALAGDRHANVVAFVGCAAGLKPDDHKAGDVIVADRMHNPATGKQVSTDAGNQMLGRDYGFNISAPVLSHVRMVINDGEWNPEKADPRYRAHGPHAYIGPIVASESVQAAEDSPLLAQVQARYQNAYALDMESYGAAAGADFHGLPTLAVRGISDFIVNKDEEGNDNLQPVAANHAAQFLRLVFTSAHPHEFRAAAGGPPPATSPTNDNGSGSATDPAGLLGSVRVWIRRLERRSSGRAAEALKDVTEARAKGGLATWANHRVHHPPKWLREDDTGDGWALVASIAGQVESVVAHRAYDRAAEVASGAGEAFNGAYLRLCAAVNRVAVAANKTADPHAYAVEVYGKELEQFPADELALLGPLPALFAASFNQNALDLKAQVEQVVAALGLSDQSGVLNTDQTPAAKIELDEELRNLAAGSALRQLAERMLMPNAADTFNVATGLGKRIQRGNPVTRDLADDAHKLATWALTLRPDSEAAQLTEAQAMLGVLVALTGREVGQVEFEVSKRATVVETAALAVRDSYRRWEIESGPALAAAGRARSMQGDLSGALRLLCSPPNGSATPEEGKHPDVVRFAAFMAMSTRNRDLALELIDLMDDKVEATLMKASIFDDSKSMGAEANRAQLDALREAGDRKNAVANVLLGISGRFNAFDTEDRKTIERSFEKVAAFDEHLAEVLRARCAISDRDPQRALQLVRAVNQHELALVTRAQALVALDRIGESIDLVFEEGSKRHDFSLITDALRVAVRYRDEERVRKIAQHILAAHVSPGVEMEALNALQMAERTASNWNAVARVTRQIVEQLKAADQPVPESEYWIEAEALYFLEQYEKAIELLLSAPSRTYEDRNTVLLLFSILRRTFDGRRPGDPQAVLNDLGGPAFGMFIQAASRWAHDEQLAALALSTALTAKHANLSESQVLKVRELSETYFQIHGEAATIRQIEVADNNLDELFEILRSNGERVERLDEAARMVRQGRFPLIALTAAATRNYSESLIRCDLGYHVAITDDGDIGDATAREALSRSVVVDTSALVIGSYTGIGLRKLIAEFDVVTLPFDLREDLARGRANLALRSIGSMGWNSRLQRPVLTEVAEDVADAWSEAADQLWDDITAIKVGRIESGTDEPWMSAIDLAKELGAALWADDVALRAFARSLGVPAFGSLDLVAATRPENEAVEAVRALREHRVVDLPFEKAWYVLAADANWDPSSPFLGAITRPAAWRDPLASVQKYQALIRSRPDEMDAEQVVAWTHAAATGLAQALPRATAPTAVAAVLAWTIFNTDTFFTDLQNAATGTPAMAASYAGAGQITNEVLKIAVLLRDDYYAEGGGIEPVIAVLGQGLHDTIGPAAAGQYMATLLSKLDEDTRRTGFAAYLQAVQD